MDVMETIQTILAICGGISAIGGAAAVVWKCISPTVKLSTRNKTSQEIIKELKTNIANLQRLGCSGAFYDGYYSAVKDICRMLEGK